MPKRCGKCEQTKFTLEEDSAEFRIWYEGHQDDCSATLVRSSGAMKQLPEFSPEQFVKLLEDEPIKDYKDMGFQPDDYPAYYVRPVREYLDMEYNRKWIGRHGSISPPSRSLSPFNLLLK
ncbi:hypothetical protein TNCV_3188291 [Trichonephila clavipes]|nr:hypothetical protein TNCV_3188291 [Trichonephila clavipes]